MPYTKAQIEEMIDDVYLDYITMDDAEYPTIFCSKTYIYRELKETFGSQIVCDSIETEVTSLKNQVVLLKEAIDNKLPKDFILFRIRRIHDELATVGEALIYQEEREWAQE